MDLLGYHNNTVEILTNDISLLLLTSMNEGTPIVVSVRLLSTLFALIDVLISSMFFHYGVSKSAVIILT